MDAARLYAKGLPLVAGGQLDQPKAFIDAARFVGAEDAYWKSKCKIRE